MACATTVRWNRGTAGIARRVGAGEDFGRGGRLNNYAATLLSLAKRFEQVKSLMRKTVPRGAERSRR